MTDDSKNVLRWEMDNATTRLATGRVESGVFEERGFRWTVALERGDREIPKFILRCDAGHNRPWKCEADAHFILLYASEGEDKASPDEDRCIFDANDCSFVRVCDSWSWANITKPCYITNGAVIFEVRINIITSEGGELFAYPAAFAAPNRRSDVILKIGDEKLHVSKELLAVHSPVFEALFFGDFAEKGKDEIEIKDVIYEEFRVFLHFIYLGKTIITNESVLYLLKLADRFQIERILGLAMMYLIQSSGIDIMKKILVADEYNLTVVKDHCLKSFTSGIELLKKLNASPEYDNLSVDMKLAICDRMVKLKLE